jgi:hypothetical protein
MREIGDSAILLAYHIAVLRGANVDQPRNLARSVTVELAAGRSDICGGASGGVNGTRTGERAASVQPSLV